MTDPKTIGVVKLTPELLDEIGKVVRHNLDELKAVWEKEGPAAMEAFAKTGATLDTIGGNCPVQAEGTVDGHHFYFRARHSGWQFHVAKTEPEIFNNDVFYLDSGYGEGPHDAGWMPEHEAIGFIITGIHGYRIERDLKDAHDGQGNSIDFTDWVKNMADDDRGTLQEAAKAWIAMRGIDNLPDGLVREDGVIKFRCRTCDQWVELPVAPEEYDHDSDMNLCGGSPRCCP